MMDLVKVILDMDGVHTSMLMVMYIRVIGFVILNLVGVYTLDMVERSMRVHGVIT